MTATATIAMQDELRRVLGRDLTVLSSGLLRENLHLSVQRLDNDEEKLRALVEGQREQEGAGSCTSTPAMAASRWRSCSTPN